MDSKLDHISLGQTPHFGLDVLPSLGADSPVSAASKKEEQKAPESVMIQLPCAFDKLKPLDEDAKQDQSNSEDPSAELDASVSDKNGVAGFKGTGTIQIDTPRSRAKSEQSEASEQLVGSQIEKIIRAKLGGEADTLKVEDFEVILLDGIKLDNNELSLQDKAYLNKFNKATHLSMSACRVKTLKNLPQLPKLERLDLSDNMLAGDDLHQINMCFKGLVTLSLNNNAIRSLDNVALLNKCNNLQSLDLSANPVTEIHNYRQNVFHKLMNLEALDGFNKEGSEWSAEDPADMRFDEAMVQDNDFMGGEGGFYDKGTILMNADSSQEEVHSESDQEEDGSDNLQGNSEEEDDSEEDVSRPMSSSKVEAGSSISSGDELIGKRERSLD